MGVRRERAVRYSVAMPRPTPETPRPPAKTPKTSPKTAAKKSAAPKTAKGPTAHRRRLPMSAEAAGETYALLRKLHPDAHCELDHTSPFQLVVATVLSAQTTDKLVNQITPELFATYGTPEKLAAAEVADVERILSRMGMFRQKAKNIVGLANMVKNLHHGEVPRTMDELTALPGVGRKTANVVMGTAFDNAEGIVVDTHVQRLAQRLGWTKQTEPTDIEEDLLRLFPKPDYAMLSHTLIFHGRRVCGAQRPACGSCGVASVCPSAGQAERVGRKPPRARERPGTSKAAAKPKRAASTKPAATKDKTADDMANTKTSAPKKAASRGKTKAPSARADRAVPR